jgi:radical SAM protein with 4Fe4S-binding SPASM domain
MKSKIEPISGMGRVILADAVPLDTPFSVVIYPTSYCNFRCVYCAHSLSREEMLEKYSFTSNVEMSMKTFRRIIEQLKEFPQKIKSVMFIGQGEPLLHKQIAEMVFSVKQAGIAEKIEMLSNCSLLTESLSDSLIDAGLDILRASIQGVTDRKYREICGSNIRFQKIADNLAYFYSRKGDAQLFVKTMDIALENAEEREMFYRTFENISDRMFIETCQPVYSGVEATDCIDTRRDRYGREHAPRKVCPLAFFMLGIFPEGVVVPCDAIYKPVILGDVNSDTLLNMWNGNSLREFQIEHLKNRRAENSSCALCCAPDDVAHPEDDLDERVEEVLKKLCVKI